MSILWCGGEDIDFPNGSPGSDITTAGNFRAGYARCSFSQQTNGNLSRSSIFPGGAITSGWLSARMWTEGSFGNVQRRVFGFGLSGTVSGLFIGTDSSVAAKLALCTYDGTTTTQLAAEVGTSLSSSTLFRIDIQLVGPLSAATVNVFLNGVLIITYTGSVLVSGLTNYDSVFVTRTSSIAGAVAEFSEIIVADEDTRAFPGLVTLALTGAGTTDLWTGTFSNINGTAISDANPAFTNTTAQDEEFNWTDLPAGTFAIKAVKIAARMAKSASPAVTQVKLGYNSGGSVAFGSGATKALTTAYATYEQLDSTNPVTSAAFVQSDMNALQVDVQSLT